MDAQFRNQQSKRVTKKYKPDYTENCLNQVCLLNSAQN